MKPGGNQLKCSFCGKSQQQVVKLIAGPGVSICDQCIDLCNEIIVEALAKEHSDDELGAAAKEAGDALARLRTVVERSRE